MRLLFLLAALCSCCSLAAAATFAAKLCVFPSSDAATDVVVQLGNQIWRNPADYDCSDYMETGLGPGTHAISVNTSRTTRTGLWSFSRNAIIFSLWVDPDTSTFVVAEDAQQPDADLNNAWVRLVNLADPSSPYYVWTRSSDCYRCNNSVLDAVQNTTVYGEIDSNYDTELSVSLCNRSAAVCAVQSNQTYHFGERGTYTIVISAPATTPSLSVYVEENGDADHGPDCWPIMYAFLIYLAVGIVYVVGKHFIVPSSRARPGTLLVNTASDDRRGDEAAPLLRPAAPGTSLHAIADPSRDKERLQSLDSFRGLSLCIMIFVNAGGGDYYFFQHSHWNGLTVADLVFPWFIWIMGTSMAVAFNSLLSKNTSRWTLLYKLLRRTCILFLLGMMVIGSMEDLDTFRVANVLQRFSVSYLGVGLLIMYVPRLQSLFTSPNDSPGLVRGFSTYSPTLPNMSAASFVRLSWLEDIAPYLLEWVAVLVIVLIHTLITFLLPVPGCPTGYLGPGGVLGEFGQFYNGDCTTGNHCCVGGAAGLVDRAIITPAHLYGGPTCGGTYGCGPFDPEGILGALNSIVLCYLGLQAGRIIVHYRSPRSRIKRWLMWAAACGVIAGGLCGFTRDEGVIPVNKNLWSLSFTLCMSSFGFVMLTICYVLIDVWGIWSGAPFRYVGLNSIVVYIVSEVLSNRFPLRWVWHEPVTHGKILFMNLTAVSCLTLMAYYMFTINFFVRI